MRKIEDHTAETKAKSFTTPTNEAVVKAWEAFDKRVVDVYDPDIDVEIERGSRLVRGIGGAGDIIRGIELRKENPTPAEELDAWMKVSNFMGDVFPRFSNTDADKALLIVDEWNNLMDAIAHDDDEATPEIRQAAKDQKIVALGHTLDCAIRGILDRTALGMNVYGMEVYDDTVCMDEIISTRKPNGTTPVNLYYTTPDGVEVAVYPGWDGPDEIIRYGGFFDGVYIRPSEVESAVLFEKLSDEVRAELEPLAGGDPAEWNGKILEIIDPDANPKDAKLLDALWIEEEVYGGAVTVYGVDAGEVIYKDEEDFKTLGLHRIKSDEDDENDEDAMDFGL